MAPPKAEHTIDRTPEYEEFIKNVKAFHELRGTNFDPEPKMGNLVVDVLKLFNYVVELGGYDKVSEEKLMWRKVCEILNLMRTSAPADAYSLKQIFYKNLAAYEIKTIHNKEPPPPEILEYTTAKGGSLLTRTLENYPARDKPGHRESEISGDDGTPVRDRAGASDTPGSGRAARGLREAPPQRVIFQPDTSSSTRQSRHASNQHSSSAGHATSQMPQHQGTPSHPHPLSHHNQGHPPPMPVSHPYQQPIRGASYIYNPPEPDLQLPSVMNWEPARTEPIPLGIANTPSSDPSLFAQKQRALRRQIVGEPPAIQWRFFLPPGNLDGPNIYERCLLALRSTISAEQAFALNHLVKISFERGDKYKFSQFPGLCEGLTEKALEIGSLFYDVDWTISYDPFLEEGPIDELDGINGTTDILERIAQLKSKGVQDTMQTAEFSDQMVLITEAVLTIRNMVMLPENAYFMSEFMPLKDLLCIILNLPHKDVAVELKHFALDIAEQITPCVTLASDDALYKSLLNQLQSTDRGTILTALRALGRIAMNTHETNKLGSVPPKALQQITDWLLLNDDELMDACLDFLYQYTAVVSNLDVLLEATRVDQLVSHLIRLLSHGAKRVHRDDIISQEHSVIDQPTEEVHHIPRDLLEKLVATEEPERCYAWLRCLFEEDPESQITQIAIWQAYNAAFLERLKETQKSMINAAEFIRNISQVYNSAGAQIVRDRGPGGEVQRFIIKGIRPRPHPISMDGKDYFRCYWNRVPGRPNKCCAWFLTANQMGEHILEDHLNEKRDADNRFKNHDGVFTCQWGTCTKYPQPTQLNLLDFANHIKIHVKNEERNANPPQNPGEPGIAQTPSSSSKRGAKQRFVKPAKTITLTFEETATTRDERNPNAPPQAAGIPLSAVLILRNIARNIVKTNAEEALVKEQQESPEQEQGGWNERLFRTAVPRLAEIMTENRVMAPHVTSLLQLLGGLSS